MAGLYDVFVTPVILSNQVIVGPLWPAPAKMSLRQRDAAGKFPMRRGE